MKRIVALAGAALLAVSLAACVTHEHAMREQERLEDFICIKRGGDYAKCRVAVAEERKACLKQWYALPPEQRTRLTLQKPETRPPGIRACNALNV